MYITAEFEGAKHALNQAVVWSRIVEARDKAAIKETLRMEYPYALTDPGDPPCCPHSHSATSPLRPAAPHPCHAHSYRHCRERWSP